MFNILYRIFLQAKVIIVLTDWFARKNVDVTIILSNKCSGWASRSITHKFVLVQSGSEFYKRAKLTGAQAQSSYFSDTSNGVISQSNNNICMKLAKIAF